VWWIDTDLPDGNSKYSTFEVDTRVQNKPTLRVEVVIDGQEAWKSVLGYI
jgi:alkaline phosphatase D